MVFFRNKLAAKCQCKYAHLELKTKNCRGYLERFSEIIHMTYEKSIRAIVRMKNSVSR